MKKILIWLKGLFNDECNAPSSKRFIGIISGLALCFTLIANSFSPEDIRPSDAIINAVALLAFGCLGLSSVDKYTKKVKDEEDESYH
jgi:hypothetical protein